MDLISLPDLSFVVDNMEEGILFLDKNRRIVTINKSALKMIGQKEGGEVTFSGSNGTWCH